MGLSMAHDFAFSVIAGTVQVRLRTGDDIAHLAELDPNAWLMLSCAVTAMGPEGESVLRALDTDGDGRVRLPEVLAAVEWLKPRLSSFDKLFSPSQGLSNDDIAGGTPEGAPLAGLFARLAPDGEVLTSSTLGEAFDRFRALRANGDGVVPTDAAGAEFVPLGEAVIAVTGGTPSANGGLGVSAEALKAFDAAREAYRTWRADEPKERLPGDLASDVVTAAVMRLKEKVAAYFLNCDLLRYNPAAAGEFAIPCSAKELANGPVALPSADARALSFSDGINPEDAADMALVAALAEALEPEARSLTPELWARVWETVAPFAAWVAQRPACADVFDRMTEAVWAVVEAPAGRAAFSAALAEDSAQAPLASAFDDLRRLLTLRVGFLRFLRNFVNVEDLYPPQARALFQTGTLFMDGRACTLCFPVEKAAVAHAAAAGGSNCCLAYCSITRPATGETRTLCAVFTAGSATTLAVGRNGIFFDLDGRDWEATLVHLVPSVMSVGEAFFAPWRRIGVAISETTRKLVAGKDASTALASRAETILAGADRGKGPGVSANGGATMASVATLGIALSFVATAVAGIVATLTNTPVWKTGLVVLGIILAVSLPNVFLTWLRLRRRDLAPILNASGWAVNRRIGLTPALGRFFTRRAVWLGRRFVPAPPMTRVRRWPMLVLSLTVLLVIIGVLGWFFCPWSPRNRAATAVAPDSVPVSTSMEIPTK